MCPHRVTWIKTKRQGVVCEERTLRRSQAGRAYLGSSYKATKCNDTGTGDLSVLNTHETSPCFSLGDAGATHLGWMQPKVQVCKIIDHIPLRAWHVFFAKIKNKQNDYTFPKSDRRPREFNKIRPIWFTCSSLGEERNWTGPGQCPCQKP